MGKKERVKNPEPVTKTAENVYSPGFVGKFLGGIIGKKQKKGNHTTSKIDRRTKNIRGTV